MLDELCGHALVVNHRLPTMCGQEIFNVLFNKNKTIRSDEIIIINIKLNGQYRHDQQGMESECSF